MSYRPHDQLAEPARPSASLLRLGAGIVTLLLVFMVILLLVNWLQIRMIPAPHQADWAEALYTAGTPLAALVNLMSFVFAFASLSITMRLVHSRRWQGLIGPPGLALRQFFAVIRVLILLNLVLAFLPAPDGLVPTLNLAVGLWLLYLPLTLLGILIQTGTEELLFRGYLQSQLAARFRSPLIWIGLPALVFGLLHFNPNVDETAGWLVVSWAVVFALAAGDLTARSGTLGPAIALHMVNNTLAIALFAPKDNFDGLALYTVPMSISDTDMLIAWMPVELLILLCSWLAARLALRV